MTAPSVGIKDLLVAAPAVGVFPPTNGDWNIYISQLPTEPDRVISLYDSGGISPNPRWLLDRPDVTVMVRGKDYADGYAKAEGVKNRLLGIAPQTVSGNSWLGIIQIGDIIFTGYDDKERPIFTLTFRIWIEPANTAGDNRDPL